MHHRTQPLTLLALVACVGSSCVKAGSSAALLAGLAIMSSSPPASATMDASWSDWLCSMTQRASSMYMEPVFGVCHHRAFWYTIWSARLMIWVVQSTPAAGNLLLYCAVSSNLTHLAANGPGSVQPCMFRINRRCVSGSLPMPSTLSPKPRHGEHMRVDGVHAAMMKHTGAWVLTELSPRTADAQPCLRL